MASLLQAAHWALFSLGTSRMQQLMEELSKTSSLWVSHPGGTFGVFIPKPLSRSQTSFRFGIWEQGLDMRSEWSVREVGRVDGRGPWVLSSEFPQGILPNRLSYSGHISAWLVAWCLWCAL